MKAFRRGKLRLQLMLADFHALWLRWKPAERLYTDLLENHRLSDNQTAVVLRCLAQNYLLRGKPEKARRLLRRILDEFPRAPAAQPALHHTAKSLKDTSEAVEYYLKAHRLDPGTNIGMLSLYHAGMKLWMARDFKRAETVMHSFVQQYPTTYWSDHARSALAKIERKKTKYEIALMEMLERDDISDHLRRVVNQKLEKIRSREDEQ